jgi:hypothetical protein
MATKQAEQEQEDDLLITELLQNLSETSSYTCSSLTRLNGGVANFVFRGVLSQPLKDNDSIIIKHAKDYVALNPNFKLSTLRCVCIMSLTSVWMRWYINKRLSE